VVTKSGPGGSFTFGWSYDNRLSAISGAATAGYGYDYQGRRSGKTVSGATTTYLYDGLNLVSESGASSAYYLFGPGIDEPVAMSRGGQNSYYVTDALGSVNALTNSSGTVQNSYLYDAWGQTRNQTGLTSKPVHVHFKGGWRGRNPVLPGPVPEPRSRPVPQRRPTPRST
jgi:uncharacterized protein RhaS with RHS repeats